MSRRRPFLYIQISLHNEPVLRCKTSLTKIWLTIWQDKNMKFYSHIVAYPSSQCKTFFTMNGPDKHDAAATFPQALSGQRIQRAISELKCTGCFSKRVLLHSLSYENELSFTCRWNSFSYERIRTRPGFEKEAQDNSEMAYWRAISNPESSGFGRPLTKKSENSGYEIDWRDEA